MKDENTKTNEWNSETEWNRISQNAGQYNRSSFFGGERIRVTFSQKMEDNSNQDKTDSDNDLQKNRNDKPEEKNPNIPQKPEKGDGGEQKKDKPEIRYDMN